MAPGPIPKELYEIIKDLSDKFDTQFDALATSVNGRLDKMASEIADMRVRMAEAQVLAVRLDAVEKEAARIERRAASEIQTAMQYITQIRDEQGRYQVDHSQTHQAIQVAQTKQAETLKQLGGKWGNVRAIVIPLVVGVLAVILTTALSNTF